jgi:hypothetical protein
VIAADTGAPLRGTNVSLGSSGLKEPRTAVTDGQGRYEIKELAAGRYMLSVSPGKYKAMYLGTAPGQGREARVVEVADEQVLGDVDFKLVRALAITGRVVDEFGDPMTNIRVSVVAKDGAAATTAFASSDDLGHFRLFGLEPGDYLVKGEGGIMSGLPANLSLQQINDDYVPTYYPGTPSLSEAPLVKLELGRDLTDLEIRMTRGRAYRIAGVVLGLEGQPAAGTAVVMVALGPSQSLLPAMGVAQTKPDGSFALEKVTPADYLVAARSGADTKQASNPVRVSIVSADVENLTLTMVPGATLAGQIVTDEGAVPDFRPTGPATALPIDRAYLVATSPLTAPIREDWSFELTGARALSS